jgi:hypothetical protein
MLAPSFNISRICSPPTQYQDSNRNKNSSNSQPEAVDPNNSNAQYKEILLLSVNKNSNHLMQKCKTLDLQNASHAPTTEVLYGAATIPRPAQKPHKRKQAQILLALSFNMLCVLSR